MAIKFYGKDCEYWCFSNFSFHPVIIDGLRWTTNEHYYQAQKYFGVNPERMEQIRLKDTPGQAKTMGNAKRFPIRPDWEQVKEDVMRKVCLVKATTHEDVKQMLLSTGNEEIIENSPTDYVWGCGANGAGKNMLGKIWVEVREIIKVASLAQ